MLHYFREYNIVTISFISLFNYKIKWINSQIHKLFLFSYNLICRPQASWILCTVAGQSSLKYPVIPICARADCMASFIAARTDNDNINGGSPTDWKSNFFYKEILNKNFICVFQFMVRLESQQLWTFGKENILSCKNWYIKR
jgi:hypothetical protein